MLTKDQIIGKTCALCNTRPATEAWSDDEGAMGWIHSQFRPACMICILERQITFCKKQVARLQELETQLSLLKAKEETDKI